MIEYTNRAMRMKYDSILYGNGLTLHTLSAIQKQSDDPFIKYLSISEFMSDFSSSENHRRIVRDFKKFFHMNKEVERAHDYAKEQLRLNAEEMNALGLERWASKYWFSDFQRVKQLKTYVCILYNYWFDYINQHFLQKKFSRDIVQKISNQIRMRGKEQCRYFTLNFDTIHDVFLQPEHLHGKFISPLSRMEEIIFHYLSPEEFLYTFLFATNGLAKLNGLTSIQGIPKSPYDLGFLFDHELYLGDLLILGVGFGNAEFMNEIRQVKDDYDNLVIVNSVDGHILQKLKIKIENHTLNSITISFYKESEVEHYTELLNSLDLLSYAKFVPSSQILEK